MKKFVQKCAVAGAVALSSGSVLAEGAFDPVATLTTATTNVGGIATGIGGLLGAAALIYAGFLGYRKYREGMNKA